MTTTVKVGVVGTGALGRLHAKLYGQCEGVELVGVCDASAETAARVAEEAGTRVFASPEALAAEVDGLSVAVPTDRHFEVVSLLLGLGRHVLVEKPIAADVTEAEALVALAAQQGVVLQVGHVERFNPVLECLDRVEGPPRFIEAHRLAPYPPARPGLPPRGTEVSVVLDLMIHDIDVILDLVRSPILRLEAVGVPVLSPTEDIANARLVFENGCTANLTTSRISQERVRKIRVFKSNAYLSLDYQEKKGEIAYRTATGIAREPVPVHDSNALLEELRDFARCVRETASAGAPGTPRVPGHQGLEALRVAQRILDAMRQPG
jgi:predicted dehydrogenase